MNIFNPNINFNIVDLRWKKMHKSVCKKSINDTILYFQLHNLHSNINFQDINFSILLASDTELLELNKQSLNKSYSTDILSYNCDNFYEIAISYDKCFCDAKDFNIKFNDRLKHLIVHGVLHCVGYDHEDEDDFIVMRSMEERILKDTSIVKYFS